MIELFEVQPQTNVQEAEYKRLLGYPAEHVLTDRARELTEWARRWYAENGKPWVYARQIERLDLSKGRLNIDGVDFSSPGLVEQFIAAQAHTAVLVAVSAGKECEEKAHQLWLEEKPDEYFFLEIYGSAVVEHLITTTGARLCAWADQHAMAVLPHCSPGYPEWDISDQKKLLELIRRKNFRAEIQVRETGMLKPKKSLLAVFGITEQVNRVQKLAQLIPCENCSMPSCQYRRKPYRKSRSQIEDVRRLQSTGDEASTNRASIHSALDRSAKYSIDSRALRKWSQQRLHLNILDDGSVSARFRYEGTTCSNLGHRLEYDYHLKLGSAEDEYKIIEMSCAPAPGDTGHAYMCEYLNNARLLEEAIAKEKPLLGRPLNEVLAWKRQFNPSGCYCDRSSREHKWGLALEVIHYALAQHDEQTNKQEDANGKILEYQS
ncbi:MAG: hypothetical protein ONB46_10450 [candidate division KSB1 bacterium]|nr:hypothetical protein [candidate division KSB1 bacterium]MDZ7366225.1 hypothetical protein [candidate division KSB1 bacterium]MDZ7404443.1 hypothetical protein [candidate division KSB1 bacterium]